MKKESFEAIIKKARTEMARLNIGPIHASSILGKSLGYTTYSTMERSIVERGDYAKLAYNADKPGKVLDGLGIVLSVDNRLLVSAICVSAFLAMQQRIEQEKDS